MNSELLQDYLSQGISLMSNEKYDLAKESFEEALKIDNKCYEAYIHLGNALVNLEEYDEALSSFRNALMISADSGEALFSIGNIYLLKDERAKAVEYYNKAEENGFQRSDLYQILAGIFFDAGDASQALRNITKAISVDPLNEELYVLKTQIFVTDGKLEEALEVIEELQKIIPNSKSAFEMKARIYIAMMDFENAIKNCDEGIDRCDEPENLELIKLQAFITQGEDEKALQQISSMKQNGCYDKVYKEATVQESILLLKKQEVDTTVSLLENANKKLEDDADILYLLMTLFQRKGNFEKVVDLSTKLIAADPDLQYDSMARYSHAEALEKTGKVDEAKREYKEMTSSLRKKTIENPGFYEGYILRLLSHSKVGEYDQALKLSDYIENLYPERADAHAFRYYIYKEMGDTEKAEAEKSLAKNIDPMFQL